MNSTTDHTIDQDNCLACQEERQAPMTSPDDIELREALTQLVVENQYIDGMTEYMPDTALDSTMELIATYRKKWEAEADRATLETLYSILNGDDNQVDTAKTYIWNKLKVYETPNAVDLSKPEVNKPTLRDVVDGTPKGQQAVSEALERSAETMNNTVEEAKKIRLTRLREVVTEIIYGADWRKDTMLNQAHMPDVEAIMKAVQEYK